MKKLGMKKVWVPVIALCSVGLIVGTGYAAWTIALNQSGETSGNRQADTVVDIHIKVTGIQWYTGVSDDGSIIINDNKVKNNKPVVCFGWADQVPAVVNPWLEKGDDVYKENRAFTLYFEIEKGKDLKDKTITPTISLTVNDTSDHVYGACTTGEKPLLVTPTNLAPKTILGTTDNGNQKYYVNVEWQWGSAFAGKNPYVYYNSQSEADADASGAATNLEKLSKLNTSTAEGANKDKPNFKVTITATTAA